jgi:uncharacterized protein (DUF305 family)
MMRKHYWMLGANLTASLAVMYVVMFAMIDGLGDFYHNLNMLWMALAMVAPMGMLMLLMMRSMYSDRRLNLALHAGFALLFVGALAATRVQAGIGDNQFLRSMIPHHSGAILMCREASIEDAEIAALCARIRRTQREEIEQMRAILARS